MNEARKLLLTFIKMVPKRTVTETEENPGVFYFIFFK